MRKLCCLTAIALLINLNAFALTTSADSALLLDAHSGRVLYAQNADERHLIASTTKIMTGFLALQMAEPSEVVDITRADTLVEGTRVYFKEGDRLTVGELLIGVLLQSGNDAALALARYCGGQDGVQGFVDAMNGMASVIGMTGSRFANPHGLNSDENYSTARDMALLAQAAMALPAFAEIVAKKTGAVGEMTVRNHNKMLWNYEGANGIKTGYTQLAGRCLVSSAERGGQLLIAVTLDDPSDWQDHADMLDFGFNNFPERRLCTAEAFMCEMPVVSGTSARADIRVRETVTRALKEEELQFVRAEVELPRFLWAPIEQGETVGLTRFFINGECVGQSELYAASSVSEYVPTKKEGLWNAFKRLLRLGG
ncbi:D-alanyl-D-alanine carboxypeptidase DacB [Clostridia bacterium]|nr:D-alanyl-D-alanine carboxypeptidase DacB [Clostridia bacterium]